MKRLLALSLAVGLAVVLTSCGTNTAPPPSQGQVQFSSGSLQAPGATIVDQGRQYSGTAPVKANDLVGVILNSKTYLVFTNTDTAGQDLTLSDKLSDQAVADFIAQPMLQTMSQAGLSTQATYDKTLSDGIGVSGLSAGSGPITFANLTDRWIAVQPGEGGQSAFVPPQTWLNIDAGGLISAAIDQNISELLVNSPSTSMPRQASFQTYGSVIRLLVYPAYATQIDLANLKQAYDTDPTLYMELNGVEFLDIATGAMEHVVATADISNCISPVVDGVLATFRASGYELLNQDTTAVATAGAGLVNAMTGAAECAATGATVGTADVVIKVVNVISDLSWLGNLAFGTVESAYLKYYAQLSVPTTVQTFSGFSSPGGVAVDSGGDIWIVNGNSTVTRLNASAPTINTYSDRLPAGGEAAVDGSGNIWVYGAAPPPNGTVVPSSSTVAELSSSGTVLSSFPVPYGITGFALDSSGNLWMSEYGGGIVNERSPSGTSITTFDSPSTLGGAGLAFDASGNLWFVGYNTDNVVKFNSSGTVIASGSVGSYPGNVAIDPSGNVWVVNTNGNSVTELNSTGTTIRTYPVGTTPGAIAVDHTGNIWIVNKDSNNVTELSSTGSLKHTYPVGTSPSGITIDGAGNVWISNTGDNTVTELMAVTTGPQYWALY